MKPTETANFQVDTSKTKVGKGEPTQPGNREKVGVSKIEAEALPGSDGCLWLGWVLASQLDCKTAVEMGLYGAIFASDLNLKTETERNGEMETKLPRIFGRTIHV